MSLVDVRQRTGKVVAVIAALTTVLALLGGYRLSDANAAAGQAVLSVNAGGPASGTFATDAYFTSGTVATHPNVIDVSGVPGAAPTAVYQTERYGPSTYTLPGLTSQAAYTVRLHFAETYFTAAGQRQFNAAVNGQQVLTNFDIVGAAGAANKAVVREFPATASAAGQIVVAFTNGAANNATIDGIEVVPAAPATVRVEAGGTAAYTDTAGNVWAADSGFTGGAIADRGNIAIAGTSNPRIFQTERYGMSGYAVGVPNGAYTVNLLFAETYTGITAAGQRVFNVDVEGTAINNIDIFAAVGRNAALTRTATVTVTDGQLNIGFTAVAQSALVNGIEIIGGGANPSPTTTSPSPNPTGPGPQGPAISPLLVGNNVWYNPSDAVWNVSGGAGLKIIRIGGIEYDQNFPSTAQLTTWVNKIKAMGAEPMIQVSSYKSATDAANVVRYFNQQTGNKVKYWNIGNEPWLERGRPDQSAVAVTIANYIKPISSAMKAVDPTIKIFGPDECDWLDTEYNSLLGGAADITGKDANGNYYIDGVSWHRYVGGDLATTGANDFLDRAKKARARVDYANQLHGRTGAAALQWGIGEFNASDGSGVCQFANGQMFAQIYGYVMKYGGTYATTWSMQEGGGACGGTDFGFVSGNLTPRSSYYHMQMVSKNFSGTYVDGTSNVSALRTYGAVDTDKIAVMLINVGGAQTCTVRLNNDAVSGGCTVNIGANTPITFTQAIGAQTSMVLVFNRQGQFVKRITYGNGMGAPQTS
ncbi:malectin domain-containing carbohydrate-binding protein [Micromonospora sp. R77]|uniref:malectin domain-containing carbohydrate-binding protein n=1 Tax=Micromonospora sp. R77 TaxID=2925836 RepID=UPI001F606BF3|nr:malectin domain-containing carbohydrate-binding protein [Micromonospora sp. R77]MCI4066241.1 malectin domain-containing carbohydrate-binding protein [Micromonospora sp. R77]